MRLPVNEVTTRRMPPIHIPPLRSEGIVLIVEMIRTILVKHPIRIIHPSVGRRMVVARMIVVLLTGIEAVREL